MGILVAAKKAVTCIIASTYFTHTLEDWKAIVTEIYKMEILTFSSKLKKKAKGCSFMGKKMEGICGLGEIIII